MCDQCRHDGEAARERRVVVELELPDSLVAQLTHRLGTIERQGAEALRLIRNQGVTLMSFREDFDAAEARVESEISAVVSLLTNLPSSVDELTQADLDRVKAQGDSLAAVLPSTVEPTDPTL